MDDLLPELDRLAGKKPEVGEGLAFYRAALPLLQRYRQAAARLPMANPAGMQARLESGCPLLVGEELPFDAQAGRALFVRLARIVERLPSRTAAAARKIRRAAQCGDLDLALVWELLIAGDGRRLDWIAGGLGLDPQLLRTLAQYSLKPAFQSWAGTLQETVDLDGWHWGVCPICGGSPTLAEIQGKEGIRLLRCGLCGAGWRYPYLECVCCHDPSLLRILAVEGEEERYRLQACDACHGYIKMVTTFEPIPVDLLPVHDLATLHLDLIAAERGYTRPSPLADSGRNPDSNSPETASF